MLVFLLLGWRLYLDILLRRAYTVSVFSALMLLKLFHHIDILTICNGPPAATFTSGLIAS